MPDTTETYIEQWHGILPPNDPGRRLALDLSKTIQAFESQRARLRFEDEPSSFDAVLQECKE